MPQKMPARQPLVGQPHDLSMQTTYNDIIARINSVHRHKTRDDKLVADMLKIASLRKSLETIPAGNDRYTMMTRPET